ncbi:MAG: nucleotide sugar dehydrogenase [Bacteroidales bacterium]|nr:nucleotide sugar dehydrogenase [Bacteroidales bacterium]MDD3300396.1 nucleotide sugar dehydrogenase [Bacteroidales bacterium]MDD4618707.1 nucleotide sugar dehydrogenase [Bacteroidales bacterium]
MYNQLISKKIKLAVIGLGYVGLPLALEFAKHFSVIGYDINQRNLKLLQSKIDPSKEIPQESFHNRDIHFTSNSEELRDASFFVIAVPTPIDKYNKPDLRPLLSATLTVANIIQPGDYVIYESTVYPGCTYEECVPLLERVSGLRVRRDFKVGYSPERINPGDAEHSLQDTIKIVSACDSESLETTAKVYESVVTAGVHRAPDIRVAEAAKIIENTQRDVNIALMNELSILFNRMGINTYDVIQAAATKWNFVPYTPGLVGGHCIGVDPYYMVHKASELKYHPQMIASGRFVNDSMGGYIAKQTVKKLLSNDLPLLRAKVLILGVTYKENVSDIRNSKVVDIVRELQSFRVAVDVVDPHADPHAVEEEYQIKMLPKPGGKYHAVIVAVAHKDYVKMTENDFKELLDPKGLVVDLRGVFKDTIKELRYWSL